MLEWGERYRSSYSSNASGPPVPDVPERSIKFKGLKNLSLDVDSMTNSRYSWFLSAFDFSATTGCIKINNILENDMSNALSFPHAQTLFVNYFPNLKVYIGASAGMGSKSWTLLGSARRYQELIGTSRIRSGGFFSYCFDTLVPRDLDMYLVELDLNNDLSVLYLSRTRSLLLTPLVLSQWIRFLHRRRSTVSRSPQSPSTTQYCP